jgi:NAD(P)-dependent dehydrogenase (short-subunit alcohol dehydrogenase family)
MKRLQDKLALVTGGTTGIGFATAKLFQQEGARLVITGQNRQRLDQAATALGGETVALKVDQTTMSDIDSLVTHLRAESGGLDVAFINAGVTVPAPVDSVSEQDFDYLVSTNLKGPFFTMQKLIPLLGEGSAIVVNASNLAGMGVPTTSVYSATKAGLISLARTFAAELTQKGIRVNAVAPGPIDTPSMGKLGMSDAELSELLEHLTSTIPMGRIGKAEEVAKAVLYLATTDSSFMTGETITLDGGWTSL